MDPDEVLREVRDLTEEVLMMHSGTAAEKLAERVETLDSWLSTGGFLPREWRVAERIVL